MGVISSIYLASVNVDPDALLSSDWIQLEDNRVRVFLWEDGLDPDDVTEFDSLSEFRLKRKLKQRFELIDLANGIFYEINRESCNITPQISDYFAPSNFSLIGHTTIEDAFDAHGNEIATLTLQSAFKMWGYGSPHDLTAFTERFTTLPSVIEFQKQLSRFGDFQLYFVINE